MKQFQTLKSLVPKKFNDIANSYDLLASLNPGYHKHLRWSAERMALGPDPVVLDLCCGTGLSTEALARVYPRATIHGLDASEGMLERARSKSWSKRVRFSLGDATDPQAHGVTGPFDGIFMAYGIRNVPDPDRCLDNLRKLLKPGGTICFHEYSVRDSIAAQWMWHAVSWSIIVPGGLITSPKADIYRYLWRSVLDFDGASAFEQRLRDAGFVDVRTETMDGWQKGIVHSFLARAPSAS